MSLRDSWAWREALMIAKLALLATALFAGASIYITFVEHPARMLCPIPWAVAQWRPSYKRATLMQASLAVIGFTGRCQRMAGRSRSCVARRGPAAGSRRALHPDRHFPNQQAAGGSCVSTPPARAPASC